MATEQKKTTMFIVFISIAILFHYFTTRYLNSDTGVQNDPPVEDTLVKVTFIFRHGDRGPLKTTAAGWPSAVQTDEWPDGYGELTKIGKKNAYLLGQRLRSRYDKILTPHYKSSQFRAISTGVERAMMSAQLVLAGLFPPQDHQKWSDDINWTPVPVHYSGLTAEFFNCKRLHHEVIMNFRKMGSDYWQPVVKYLEEKNEEIADKKNPIREIISKYDAAVAKVRNGKQLKDWEEEFATLSAVYMNEVFQALIMRTDVQKQLTSNILANQVLNLLKSSHSVTMYSAHDIQLYLLSGAFGLNMEKPPAPTASIIIELHSKPEGDIVKVFYLHEATGKMEAVEIRGEKEVAWDKFSDLATPLDKDQYDELCNTVPAEVEYDDSEKQLIRYISTIAKQA